MVYEKVLSAMGWYKARGEGGRKCWGWATAILNRIVWKTSLRGWSLDKNLKVWGCSHGFSFTYRRTWLPLQMSWQRGRFLSPVTGAIPLWVFFFFFSFCIFRAAPMTYESSWAGGQMGALANGLATPTAMADLSSISLRQWPGSLTHWVRPGSEPTFLMDTSWILNPRSLNRNSRTIPSLSYQIRIYMNMDFHNFSFQKVWSLLYFIVI